jgi:hypothetical protein
MPPNSSMSELDCRANQRLLNVQALRIQLIETTSALATESSPEFLQRLALLELGCARLGQSLLEGAADRGSSSTCGRVPPELAVQIREEHVKLARLNYRFSGLLRRRCRSVELLLRHYQSLSRELGPGSEHPRATRSISTEV